MDEPVKPLTTLTPSRCAARAESFISGPPTRFPFRHRLAGCRYPVIGAGVVVIEHELASQVIGDAQLRDHAWPTARDAPCSNQGLFQGFLHVEVVAPTWQLNTVITPSARLLGDDLERQVGRLAGE